MSTARSSLPHSPREGEWSEADYLQRTDATNERVEFTDGRLEFLPMATEVHASQARVSELLAWQRERTLREDEEREPDQFMQDEMLIRLVKARLRTAEP